MFALKARKTRRTVKTMNTAALEIQKYSPHFTDFSGMLLLVHAFATFLVPSHLPGILYKYIYMLFLILLLMSWDLQPLKICHRGIKCWKSEDWARLCAITRSKADQLYVGADWGCPPHLTWLSLAKGFSSIREVPKSLLALAWVGRATAHQSSPGVRLRNGDYAFLMLRFRRNGRR